MTLEDGDADESVFARVLALALAQLDPRLVVEEAIRASSASSSSTSPSSSSTLDARAQATLARALRSSMALTRSSSYAMRVAREACKRIEREAREGRGDGETRDDLSLIHI